MYRSGARANKFFNHVFSYIGCGIDVDVDAVTSSSPVAIEQRSTLASQIDPSVVVSRSVIHVVGCGDVAHSVDAGPGRVVDRGQGRVEPHQAVINQRRRQQFTHTCICTETKTSRAQKQV